MHSDLLFLFSATLNRAPVSAQSQLGWSQYTGGTGRMAGTAQRWKSLCGPKSTSTRPENSIANTGAFLAMDYI
jgi:hypothetical protein